MSTPTSWWWVRHAPVPEAAGRINGQLDVDCDVTDSSSFEVLAQVLPVDAIWVISPLRRTRQTYQAIADAYGELPDPHVVAALDEIHPMTRTSRHAAF